MATTKEFVCYNTNGITNQYSGAERTARNINKHLSNYDYSKYPFTYVPVTVTEVKALVDEYMKPLISDAEKYPSYMSNHYLEIERGTAMNVYSQLQEVATDNSNNLYLDFLRYDTATRQMVIKEDTEERLKAVYSVYAVTAKEKELVRLCKMWTEIKDGFSKLGIDVHSSNIPNDITDGLGFASIWWKLS